MRRIAVLVLATLLLTACGGGDETGAPDADQASPPTADQATDADDGAGDATGTDSTTAASSVTPVDQLTAPEGFGSSEYNGPEAEGATLAFALSGTDPEAAMNTAPGGPEAEAIAAAGLEGETVVRFARPAADGNEDSVVVTQATFVDADAAAAVFERYRARAEANNDGYAQGPIDGAFEWENPAMVRISPSGEQVGPTPSARGIAVLRGNTIVVLDVFFADEATADPAVAGSLLEQVVGA